MKRIYLEVFYCSHLARFNFLFKRFVSVAKMAGLPCLDGFTRIGQCEQYNYNEDKQGISVYTICYFGEN